MASESDKGSALKIKKPPLLTNRMYDGPLLNDGDMTKAITKTSMFEPQIRSLRDSLDDWKEILLPIKSVILWDKNWHPAAIIGVSTIFFTLVWLLDPSILSALSLIGLTLTISDYIVPVLAKSLFKPELWTAVKEKQFEEICKAVVLYQNKIHSSVHLYFGMRSERPKLYYGLTVITLIVLAWIGNTFNNLFLTYLFVTVLLLVPGMEYHGILHKYGLIFSQKLSDFTSDAKAKIGHTKKEQ